MHATCGIDWAEDHHDVAVVDSDAQLLGRLRISDDAAGFQDPLRLLAEHGDRQDGHPGGARVALSQSAQPAREMRERPLVQAQLLPNSGQLLGSRVPVGGAGPQDGQRGSLPDSQGSKATAVSSAVPAVRRPRLARHRDGRASVPADVTLIGYFKWVSMSIRERSRGSRSTPSTFAATPWMTFSWTSGTTASVRRISASAHMIRC